MQHMHPVLHLLVNYFCYKIMKITLIGGYILMATIIFLGAMLFGVAFDKSIYIGLFSGSYVFLEYFIRKLNNK